MTRKRNILLVSLIAMLSVGAVRAETATVSYVDTQDSKLAERIGTQDSRIKKLNDWLNPLKNGSRATLTTEAQDAYRAINELDAAVKAIDVPEQVNADWNASSGAAQILNKPDLSQYATTSEMNTALQGKQDTLQFDNTPTAGSDNVVTSGAVAAAITAAQLDGQVDLTGYATETYVDNAIAEIPAQVNADWNETTTSSKAYIANKPTIPSDADIVSPTELEDALADKQDKIDSEHPLSSDLVDGLATVATSGDYDDLLNKPTIPEQVQSNWAETDDTEPSFIKNKPTDLVKTSDLADYAKTEDLDDYATLDDLDDYATTAALDGKQDKIDSEHPLSSDLVDGLADVATSGDYDDLLNKPTIPQQVQSDWDVTDDESPAFIAHKPTIPSDADIVSPTELSEALADKQDKIDSEHPLSSDLVDGLADVATSGDYDDLLNKPTIPQQVQANWTQTDSNEVDFIKNKPSVYTQSETDTLLAGKQATLTFDDEPKTGSSNPVTSAGIKAAIEAAAFDPTSIAIDNALSTTSVNAVQNKVVTGSLPNYDTSTNAVVTVPSDHGAYVLGYVNGKPAYIAVVDGNGDTGVDVPWGNNGGGE